MGSLFPDTKDTQGAYTAIQIGQVNGSPVFARIMQDFESAFHVHESNDEMFIVLSGTVRLEFETGSETLHAGQAYTVAAGIKHRSKVCGRAELIVIGGHP